MNSILMITRSTFTSRGSWILIKDCSASTKAVKMGSRISYAPSREALTAKCSTKPLSWRTPFKAYNISFSNMEHYFRDAECMCPRLT